MDISELGYRFTTRHNADGDVAHVEATFERFQEQAPIMPNQPYALEFYGKGSGLRIGVTTMPRYEAPGAMAAERNARVTRAISDIRAANEVLRSVMPGHPGTEPGVTMRTENPDFHSPFDDSLLPGWVGDPPVFPPPDVPPGGGGGGGGTYHPGPYRAVPLRRHRTDRQLGLG